MQSSFHHLIIKPRFLFFAKQFSSGKDPIFTSICDSLSKDPSWESLSRKFSSVQFTESFIKRVLLHLKEPVSANKALKFFYWSAHHASLRHGISPYCIAIHILVKAKLVKDAKVLIESILVKPFENSDVLCVLDTFIHYYEVVDSVPLAFDLFVQTCAKLRMVDDAVDACRMLDEHGIGLSVISYNALLHVMQRCDRIELVWSLYEHMVAKRMFPNEVSYRIMVSALCKEGRLKRALDFLERVHGKKCTAPGVVVNTCLLYGMIEEGRIEEGLVLLKWMMLKNMILDTVSLSLCVFAKVRMGDLDAAWKVFEEMRNRGFEGNSFLLTSFVWGYCKEGRVKEAIELMQEMENAEVKPYDETFNHLIQGCARAGYLEESLELCERMIKMGFVPSCSVFNEMVEKICLNGGTKRADEVLTMLMLKGFVPNEDTYSHLAMGNMRLGNVEAVLKLYHEMEYRSMAPSPSFFSSLITSLYQNGRVKEAEEYLNMVKAKSFALPLHEYETLIVGYLEKGGKTRARQLDEEMVRMS